MGAEEWLKRVLREFLTDFDRTTERIDFWNTFKPEIRFRDPETKRFISRDEAIRRFEKGEAIEQIVLYRAKDTWESLGIQKGRIVSNDKVAFFKEMIREENTIRGVMRTRGITDRDYATKLVEEIFDKYDKGEITGDDVHEILSP